MKVLATIFISSHSGAEKREKTFSVGLGIHTQKKASACDCKLFDRINVR